MTTEQFPARGEYAPGSLGYIKRELADARELLAAIRDDEVNAQDEADKFLRDNKFSALHAALGEVERLKKETETLRSLYNAKHPPHERRKCSTAHDGPIESFEELSSQSHWPECQCYECRAIFVMNQEHERAEQAERRAERLKADAALLDAFEAAQETVYFTTNSYRGKEESGWAYWSCFGPEGPELYPNVRSAMKAAVADAYRADKGE